MIIIIGSGISGLTAGNNLKGDFLILEKENYTGGLSTQYESRGYWFDFGGHYFHFKDKPEIRKYLENYCLLNEYNRKSKIFLHNRFIPFPIQHHLSYFNSDLRKRILKEIIQRRDNIGGDLSEFLQNNFGKTLFKLFFAPFMTKYYNYDLANLVPDMDRGSIPVPDIKEIMNGSKGKRFSDSGYNPVFYYPEESLRNFIKNYTDPIKDRIKLNENVIEIDIKGKKIKTKNSTFHYRYLINTIPLKEFIKKIKQKNIFPPFQQLQNISTLVSNVVLKKKLKRFHWVYLPDKKFPFYRVGFYPAQKAPVCYLEKTISKKSSIHEETLFNEIKFTLKSLNIIEEKKDIIHYDLKFIPVSYVIFDKKWKKIVPETLQELKNFGIYSTGRYGAWNYTSMSDDIKSAIEVAAEINSA